MKYEKGCNLCETQTVTKCPLNASFLISNLSPLFNLILNSTIFQLWVSWNSYIYCPLNTPLCSTVSIWKSFLIHFIGIKGYLVNQTYAEIYEKPLSMPQFELFMFKSMCALANKQTNVKVAEISREYGIGWFTWNWLIQKKLSGVFLLQICSVNRVWVGAVVSVLTHFADPDALSSIIPNRRAAIQTTAMTKTPVPTSNTVLAIFPLSNV